MCYRRLCGSAWVRCPKTTAGGGARTSLEAYLMKCSQVPGKKRTGWRKRWVEVGGGLLSYFAGNLVRWPRADSHLAPPDVVHAASGHVCQRQGAVAEVASCGAADCVTDQAPIRVRGTPPCVVSCCKTLEGAQPLVSFTCCTRWLCLGRSTSFVPRTPNNKRCGSMCWARCWRK